MQSWYNSLDHSMPELIRRAAADYGDDLFLIEQKGEALSFRQLEQRVEHAARALLGLGIEHGDRVAIWAPNSGAWIIAACAIEMIGAMLVPINTRFRGAEAGYILDKSGARLLTPIPPRTTVV